jgi:hypothetical protein
MYDTCTFEQGHWGSGSSEGEAGDSEQRAGQHQENRYLYFLFAARPIDVYLLYSLLRLNDGNYVTK